MPRYRLTLEYAGTRYAGWQIQTNARTVQGELNDALRRAAGGRVETYGAGRTDAGVHALAQVAHADLVKPIQEHRLVADVNDALPADINVLAAERMPPRFHARHSAVGRSYIYQVACRRTAFAKPFVWWVRDPLDSDRVARAAQSLIGMGDFRGVTDDDPDEKSTKVLIEDVSVAAHGDLLLIRVTGSHFLWKMVRRLVGLLVEIGKGRLEAHDLPALISGNSDLPAKLTAPASGLFLECVFYEPGWVHRPLLPPLFHLDGGSRLRS